MTSAFGAGNGRRAILALCLATAGCGRSVVDIQRDYARTLRPAATPVTAPTDGAPRAVRSLRLRAWADAGYRAGTVRWRERITEQVERANEILAAQVGVHLTLVSVEAWNHSDGPGSGPTSVSAELPSALGALRDTDPGDGADFVVGFVKALPLISSTFDVLGVGAPDKHFVVRAMDSVDDARAIGASLDKLREDERESLLRERKAHREAVIFVHEWAHAMGAGHEEAGIMAPIYSPSASALGPGALVAIRARLGANGPGAPLAASPEPKNPDAPSGEDPPRDASAGPDLENARKRMQRGDLAGAVVLLVAAEASVGGREVSPKWWGELAELYREADTCNAAERAAARADPKSQQRVAEACGKLRRWLALPAKSSSLPVAAEHVYVAEMRVAATEVSAGREEGARAAAARLDKRFPGTPGGQVLRCIAERSSGPSAIRAACKLAARAAPDAFYPPFLLGHAALAESRWAEARRHLERALEADAGVEVAWHALAQAQRNQGDQVALRELSARYRARFDAELP